MAHTVVYVHSKKLEKAEKMADLLNKAGHTCYSVSRVFPNPHVIWCEKDVCTGNKISIQKMDDADCCIIL